MNFLKPINIKINQLNLLNTLFLKNDLKFLTIV